ncbi:MAG: hypothetical protein M3083_11970 [Actinomycetota bacterium]|nr:hypothetical protein [Actinomycetota bacterium]
MATASVLAVQAGAATAPARPVQVVRRPSGQVVVILVGRDSVSEAAMWRSRGYRVESVSGEALGF